MPPAAAHPVSWDVYYTRFAGSPNLKRAEIQFDGERVTLGPRRTVAAIEGADGLVFAPDGDLLVGGQGDRVHKVRTEGGGEHVTVSAGGQDAFHLALDPSGRRAWTSGLPGHLVEIPLQPFSDGIAHPLRGDDRTITSIAFDDRGIAFYTAADHRGGGNFGVLDLGTFSTRRLLSSLPAAHAITFDPFTGDLFLFGANQIAQIDPRNPRDIKSSLVFNQESLFDQGSTDGEGHLVVARTSGHVVFIDFAVSGLVGDASNFVAAAFVDSNLDDIAPLAGLGATPTTAASSAILAGPAFQTAPGLPAGPGAAADDGSGEAKEERTAPDAGAEPGSAISWALTAFGLAILLVLTLAWGAQMLLATWRRARQAETVAASRQTPAQKEPDLAQQRNAGLLEVAQRGFAGFLAGAKPEALIEVLVRDAVTLTGSAAGAVSADVPAAQGRTPVNIQVGAPSGTAEVGDSAAMRTIEIPLERNGTILGRLTLSHDAIDGTEPSAAALGPLAVVISAILSRAEPPQKRGIRNGDESQLLRFAAQALHDQIEILAAQDPGLEPEVSDGFRAQLEKLKEIQAMLARLSSATFDAGGEESVDLGLIAEEVSADLRNRDPGRSTRITIAPDAVAVGNPERLQAAVAGLLGAAWHVSRDDEPSNIEFGVTDRGGRVVCFARCRGSATRPAESENSPVPSDGNGAQPTPDLGLSLVRYALGGPDARIWTENDEDAGPAFFFALPGGDTSGQPRTGWRMPGSRSR